MSMRTEKYTGRVLLASGCGAWRFAHFHNAWCRLSLSSPHGDVAESQSFMQRRRALRLEQNNICQHISEDKTNTIFLIIHTAAILIQPRWFRQSAARRAEDAPCSSIYLIRSRRGHFRQLHHLLYVLVRFIITVYGQLSLPSIWTFHSGLIYYIG